jgi:hypothetical protein
MWLFTKIGFFSVVADEGRRDVLVVRARDKKDLEALVAKKPEIFTEIIHLENRDYAWRTFVYQTAFAPIVSQLVLEIDYTNFKSKVMADQGIEREKVYAQVWGVMRQLQDGPRRPAASLQYALPLADPLPIRRAKRRN